MYHSVDSDEAKPHRVCGNRHRACDEECRGCSSGSCTGSNCDDGWMAASVDDNMGGDHRRTAIKQLGVDVHGSDRISECDSGGIRSEHGEAANTLGRVRMVEQHRVDLVDLGLIGAQQGRRDWSEYISDCGSDHERVCVSMTSAMSQDDTVEQQCCTVQWGLDGKHECVDCGRARWLDQTRLGWCGLVERESEGSVWTSDSCVGAEVGGGSASRAAWTALVQVSVVVDTWYMELEVWTYNAPAPSSGMASNGTITGSATMAVLVIGAWISCRSDITSADCQDG